MAPPTVADVSSTDLFQDEVPMLRPSLVKHGLVDLACPPPPRVEQQRRSCEDLRAADVEASGGEEAEGGWVRAGGPEDNEGDDTELDVLVGVDRIVVNHYRSAAEVRRTFMSPNSPRDPLQISTVQGRKRRATSTSFPSVATMMGTSSATATAAAAATAATTAAVTAAAAAAAATADVSRRGGSGSGNGLPKRDSAGNASPTQKAAAPADAALARQRDRERARGRVSGKHPGRRAALDSLGKANGSAEVEGSLSWTMVSASALMDVAVKLFGANGGTGDTDGVASTNVEGMRVKNGRRVPQGLSGGNAPGGMLGGSETRQVTFTVDVYTEGSTRLGIGVRELGGGAVVVQELQRPNVSTPGAAERAGVVVGDVILGINYVPLEKGLVHTSSLLEEAISHAGFVKLQISRQVQAGIWRQPSAGRDCPAVTDLMWRTAQLRKAGILDSGERYTIAGFILQLMAWDEGTSSTPPPPPSMLTPLPLAESAPGWGSPRSLSSSHPSSRAAWSPQGSFVRRGSSSPPLIQWTTWSQMDSLVLRVKRLREAIYVRCLHAKCVAPDLRSSVEPSKTNVSVWGSSGPDASAAPNPRATIRYVLRAEDVATGREWLVFPRYSDFSELHQQLLAIWPPIAELPFPENNPATRLLPGAAEIGGAVVEERIVGLGAFVHGALTLLGIYASVDARCTDGLRLVQEFLGTPEDLLATELKLAPQLVEQKRIELLLYKLLNQVDSPTARFKHRLMQGFAKDISVAPDVESLMKRTSSRLCRLQEFILEQHHEQLWSCLDNSHVCPSVEAKTCVAHKAVRRQVELSLLLPLRRCLCNELAVRLKGPVRNLQQAIKTLRDCPPAVFGVDYPDVLTMKEWAPAREAMGQATRRVLPTDQIEGLCRAAEHIVALHTALNQNKGAARSMPVEADRGHARNAVVANGSAWATNGHQVHPTSCGTAARASLSTVRMPLERAGGDVLPACGSSSGVSTGSRDGVLRERIEVRHASCNDTEGHAVTVGVCDANVVMDTCGDVRCNGAAGMRGSESIDPVDTPDRKSGSVASLPLTGEPLGVNGNWDMDEGDGMWDPMRVSPAISFCSDGATPSAELKADRRLRENGSGTSSSSSSECKRSIVSGVAYGNGETNSSGHPERRSGDEAEGATSYMGADDFLPLFALALVHSAPPDLLLPQTLLIHLMDVEGSLSEGGYLVVTLEAAVSFITQVYANCQC